MADPDVSLLVAARAVVDTWDGLGIQPDGQGVLWDAHMLAMQTLADVVARRPPICPRCHLTIGPEQINEKGRHLLCALHDGTLTVQCRSCLDGRMIGQVSRCIECGRTR